MQYAPEAVQTFVLRELATVSYWNAYAPTSANSTLVAGKTDRCHNDADTE